MADWRAGLNVRVSGPHQGRGKPTIDNNPTPTYFCANLGWLSFAGAFASKLPEKCRISGTPEAISGRAAC
jgi:hypothetical protein